jgi:hypothetical protein
MICLQTVKGKSVQVSAGTIHVIPPVPANNAARAVVGGDGGALKAPVKTARWWRPCRISGAFTEKSSVNCSNAENSENFDNDKNCLRHSQPGRQLSELMHLYGIELATKLMWCLLAGCNV